MTTIGRQAFVDGVTRHGTIALDLIDESARRALEARGLDADALRAVAGPDRRIDGRHEVARLHALMVERHAPDALANVRSAAFEVLTACSRQQNATPARGVLYVGMRATAAREASALRAGAPATQGGVTPVSPRIDLPVLLRGVAFPTATTADLEALGRGLVRAGAAPRQANRLVALLAAQAPSRRPFVARLGLSLWAMGRGELRANRLVLSGHSAGAAIIDDTGKSFLDFDTLGDLARSFPAGARRVEHVAIAACNCGHRAHVTLFRRIFPRLKSFFGYAGSAPLAESGGAAHLARWARATASKSKTHTPRGLRHGATWSRARGYRGKPLPALRELRRDVATLREKSYERVRRGEARVETVGYALQRYYQVLTDLLFHPRLPPAERAALRAHQQEVLRIRHPELFR